MPIPKIEVSFHHEPDFRGRIVKPTYSNTFDVGETSPGTFLYFFVYYLEKINVVKYLFFVIQTEIIKDRKRTFFEDRDATNIHSRQTSERIKKKKKIVDLKAFVGCKLLSKSEKNLQKIDYINDVMMLDTPVIIVINFVYTLH